MILAHSFFGDEKFDKMRISLRSISEKSAEVAVIRERLSVNLARMSNWGPDFTRLALGEKDKNWSHTISRDYERAQYVLRSSKHLIREALKKIIPDAKHDEVDKMALEILSFENIVGRFDQVFVEFKRQ